MACSVLKEWGLLRFFVSLSLLSLSCAALFSILLVLRSSQGSVRPCLRRESITSILLRKLTLKIFLYLYCSLQINANVYITTLARLCTSQSFKKCIINYIIKNRNQINWHYLIKFCLFGNWINYIISFMCNNNNGQIFILPISVEHPRVEMSIENVGFLPEFSFLTKWSNYRLSSHKFKIGQVVCRNNLLVSFIDKTLICSSFPIAWRPITIRYFWGMWGVQRERYVYWLICRTRRAINSMTMVVELLILIKIDLSVQWERIFLARLRPSYCDNW